MIIICNLSFEKIGIPDANSGINSPSEFNSYKVSPRELNSWSDLRVLALAGSNDSILPELATIILLELLLETHPYYVNEIKNINVAIKKLLFILFIFNKFTLL